MIKFKKKRKFVKYKILTMALHDRSFLNTGQKKALTENSLSVVRMLDAFIYF